MFHMKKFARKGLINRVHKILSEIIWKFWYTHTESLCMVHWRNCNLNLNVLNELFKVVYWRDLKMIFQILYMCSFLLVWQMYISCEFKVLLQMCLYIIYEGIK